MMNLSSGAHAGGRPPSIDNPGEHGRLFPVNQHYAYAT